MTSDEADAADFLNRLDDSQARAEAATARSIQAVEGFAQALHDHRTAGFQVSPGSAGDVDMAAATNRIGGFEFQPSALISDEFDVAVVSLIDLFRAYADLNLLRRSILGPANVARTILEVCAWTAWILDHTASPEVRMRRGMHRRLVRLWNDVRASRALDALGRETESPDAPDSDIDDGQKTLLAEVEALKSWAHSRGIAVHTPESHEARIGSHRSLTKILHSLPTATGLEPYVWASASSLAHGQLNPNEHWWVDQTVGANSAAAWVSRGWSGSVWMGTRLFVTAWAEYSGAAILEPEWVELKDSFMRYSSVE